MEQVVEIFQAYETLISNSLIFFVFAMLYETLVVCLNYNTLKFMPLLIDAKIFFTSS